MGFIQRKLIRLKEYDYSSSGVYFITICTKEKQKLLSEIVGTGLQDGPRVKLTAHGVVAEEQLKFMNEFYDDIDLDAYVIMPNHIHFLLRVTRDDFRQMKMSSVVNSSVSQFVGTFKRFCNRKYGENIWQSRSYDHIVRNEIDYREIYTYIKNNPAKWTEDRFYVK